MAGSAEMGTRNKVIGLVIGILVSSQGVANADFVPSDWTYSETCDTASGSVTSSLMTLTSADYSLSAAACETMPSYAQYSLEIPANTAGVNFSYEYYQGDYYGKTYYDQPVYGISGVETDLVDANSGPGLGNTGYTSTGSVNLSIMNLTSKILTFKQYASDNIYGPGVLKISGFKISPVKNSENVVLSESKPVISADAKSYSCAPGSYTFMRYGITKETSIPTTLVYTLIMNGIRVSTVSSDNWARLSNSIVDPSNNSVIGTATSTVATWAVDGANTKSAQCEVLAYQDSATMLAYSNNS